MVILDYVIHFVSKIFMSDVSIVLYVSMHFEWGFSMFLRFEDMFLNICLMFRCLLKTKEVCT